MEDTKDLIKQAECDSSESHTLIRRCIEKVKKEEFIADEDTAKHLATIVTRMDGIAAETPDALQLVADIARIEANRPLFKDDHLMVKLLDYLTCDEPGVCLQAVRCVANLCAENSDTCALFLHNGGVDKILTKANKIAALDEEAWNKIVPSACVCIRNMISSNAEVLAKFMDSDALSTLRRFFNRFWNSDLNVASYALSGITLLSDTDNGLKKIDESDIMTEIRNIISMEAVTDDVVKVLLDEMLTGFGGQESTRALLCKCGFVETLCEVIENRGSFKEGECGEDSITKELTELVVLLTSGEESFSVLQETEKGFLCRIASWISSPNCQIQVSAGLILGNYARSEETCREIMEHKIHENLINAMKESMTTDIEEDRDEKQYYDRLQSYASCLRNLTIPADNKPLLIEAGLHLLAMDLIKEPSMGVQFKGLGIVRLLVQGNTDVAASVMSNVELVKKICELSDVSAVTSIPSEAQRLLASLLKFSTDENVLRSAISIGVLKPVLCLLKSDHVLMQNEGLVGLIIAVANLVNCLPQLVENEVVVKVMDLMSTTGVHTQTLFNCITFLQAVSSLDGGLADLKSRNIIDVLENLKSHNEEIIRNKVTETLMLVQ